MIAAAAHRRLLLGLEHDLRVLQAARTVETPVNSLISPARAFAYRPLTSALCLLDRRLHVGLDEAPVHLRAGLVADRPVGRDRRRDHRHAVARQGDRRRRRRGGCWCPGPPSRIQAPWTGSAARRPRRGPLSRIRVPPARCGELADRRLAGSGEPGEPQGESCSPAISRTPLYTR